MSQFKNAAGIAFGLIAGGTALTGLIILVDLIGSHTMGYGKQTVEIVSIEYTGQPRSPYRLNYRSMDGDDDHMTWPKKLDGAENCKPGMLIDAIVSLSVGTPDVGTCRFPDDLPNGEVR